MPDAIPHHNPELDLETFEKEICVRPLRRDDFECIVELQLRCFPNMAPWKLEQLQSMLEIFPEGQSGVEIDGELVASSCGCAIARRRVA